MYPVLQTHLFSYGLQSASMWHFIQSKQEFMPSPMRFSLHLQNPFMQVAFTWHFSPQPTRKRYLNYILTMDFYFPHDICTHSQRILRCIDKYSVEESIQHFYHIQLKQMCPSPWYPGLQRHLLISIQVAFTWHGISHVTLAKLPWLSEYIKEYIQWWIKSLSKKLKFMTKNNITNPIWNLVYCFI